MFSEVAEHYKQSFHEFHPYPSITDRSSWDSLDSEWKEKTIALGKAYLHFEYPQLSAADFMDFLRTGNRVNYENKYFSKRHALDALVLAECAENKGRFLDDIINGIFSICEESAWQLPPHNSYVRDTPQLPLPDATAPVLDLFACETGAILSTVYYLMKSPLDNISPFITKRILHELHQRIYLPYLNSHFWWMGNGREPMNNWTIWCTQNVLLSVFFTSEDQAVNYQVFLKACRSVDYFLAEYGIDGCCDEGAQYYRHAGLCLFNVMEICNHITRNLFLPFYHVEKIKNIAAYIFNAHISGKYYVNFADCSTVAGRAGVREFLFAGRIGMEAMARFAATDFKADLPNSLLIPSENNLYYRLQNAFTIREIKAYDTSEPVHYTDICYPSVGVFIARDTHLYVAVKAGNNGDSHNHNDTGSFTVYKDGKPMFIDVGVESYTRKTFSSQRYEIWTMQSAYHNLPTVNGIMQMDGEEFEARDVRYHLSDTVCEIAMNIAGAYPRECRLRDYYRQVTLIKEKEIVIQDSFSFRDNTDTPDPLDTAGNSDQVILSLMTYEKPEVQLSGENTILTIGALGTLKLEGGSVHDIEEIPVSDPRLKLAWEHKIYRILIVAEEKEIKMTIA